MADKTQKTTSPSTSSAGGSSTGTSVEQIRKRTFGTVRRGYDPRQVSSYLASVADRVATLERQVAEAGSKRPATDRTAKAAAPAADADPYAGLSTHVAGVMKSFDQDIERRTKDADAKADRTIADAKAEAERIRLDAQIKAEEVRAEASASLEGFKKEATAEVASLTKKRDAIVSELRAIRERLIVSIDQLPKPESARAADAPQVLDAPTVVDAPTASTAPRAD